MRIPDFNDFVIIKQVFHKIGAQQIISHLFKPFVFNGDSSTKDKKEDKDITSKESEQVTDEDIKELLLQNKVLKELLKDKLLEEAVKEYCSKKPDECE